MLANGVGRAKKATVSQSAATEIDYYAVSIVGPRNSVDKIVGKLPLLP